MAVQSRYWNISPLNFRNELINQYTGISEAKQQIRALQTAKDLYRKSAEKEAWKGLGRAAAFGGLTALTGGLGGLLKGGLKGNKGLMSMIKSPEMFGALMGDKKSLMKMGMNVLGGGYIDEGSYQSVLPWEKQNNFNKKRKKDEANNPPEYWNQDFSA